MNDSKEEKIQTDLHARYTAIKSYVTCLFYSDDFFPLYINTQDELITLYFIALVIGTIFTAASSYQYDKTDLSQAFLLFLRAKTIFVQFFCDAGLFAFYVFLAVFNFCKYILCANYYFVKRCFIF
jgi:hypothetical protein